MSICPTDEIAFWRDCKFGKIKFALNLGLRLSNVISCRLFTSQFVWNFYWSILYLMFLYFCALLLMDDVISVALIILANSLNSIVIREEEFFIFFITLGQVRLIYFGYLVTRAVLGHRWYRPRRGWALKKNYPLPFFSIYFNDKRVVLVFNWH